MATDLTRIGQKALKDTKLVFTNLFHHVYEVDNLRACFDSLDAYKATGPDGVTKHEYGHNLEVNLQDLSDRLKRMGYRPRAKRRSYVPKPGSTKGRPLGISNLEDKIVEEAVKRTLEPIYESMFEASSYGYRPRRSPHTCLDAMGRTIQQERISYIVEADIRSFFDKVNHEWMVKFLRHRIGDERIIRLIQRMFKSGFMEEGLVHASEEGVPQGSILSPLLSNVYLHYVLDLWFSRRFRKQCQGEAYYFRFADDFVACFQYKPDASRFESQLPDRLGDFALEVATEKTRSMAFGRFAREGAQQQGRKPQEFTFLGFTHYCGKTRNGYFKLKRRTCRKKLGQSLLKFSTWARKASAVLRKGEMLRSARRRIQGYLNYYAITDNSDRCGYYVYRVTQIMFKWLNRKSQRKAYTWPRFNQALATIKWPTVQIRKNLDPCRRAVGY